MQRKSDSLAQATLFGNGAELIDSKSPHKSHNHIFQNGDLVSKRYLIVGCLGASAWGLVYLSHDTAKKNRPVVIKVLRPSILSSEKAQRHFAREVEIASNFNHPHLVKAYDLIETPQFTAFTMEYISGGTLAEYLKTNSPIAPELAIKWLKQICSGLHALHRMDLVHNDLKPGNLLIDSDGNLKISDFGLTTSALLGQRNSQNHLLGTVQYMSPEYFKRGKSDQRSDIYALGIVGYEMLTGRLPFVGSSIYETIAMRFHHSPGTVKEFQPKCPHSLSACIEKAMSRNPRDRYTSADQLLQALNNLTPWYKRYFSGWLH